MHFASDQPAFRPRSQDSTRDPSLALFCGPSFNITIGPSHHDSDSSFTDEEDSSGVEVSPPSTGSHDYRDPYDEWAGLPYPDELKPSDSASRPRTSHRTRSRNPIHGSSAARRHSMRNHNVIPDREQYSSRRRRAPSPESPESADSAEEYGHLYGRMPHGRGGWPPASQGLGYANSTSPVPSYVYPNGGVPHAPFGHPNGTHPATDQLIRVGPHNQFGQSNPYGHPAYPYGPVQQPPGPVPPYFPHDPHQIHTAHHTPSSTHSRGDGHNQQHPLPHPLHSHSPTPFNGPLGSHEMVPYGPGPFYNPREPFSMVPGAMSPYYNPYARAPSPSQLELAGPLAVAAAPPADAAKDEALARLEKLILDEKLEREARDKREEERELALKQAAEAKAAEEARAAHEKKITEEAAARAREEAEKKAAEEAAKAKEEAEKAAQDAAAEAAAKATEAANEAAQKQLEEVKNAAKAPEKPKPIKFKDAVGRKFSFPFDLCRTWQGMEELIRQAFLHIEVLGPHVADGHYDLIGPNGDIILPQVWETVIEPDWTITMHMWPIPEKPKDPEPEPPAEPAPEAPAPEAKKPGPKKPKPKPDPGAFAMWMVGSSQRARLNKALKVGKKPRVVQHGSVCRVM
ncbi:hypothetical protein HFD88_001725 [Aspergillus terreus]|nr:hypothetical protein HFD88_001725 [Aspergillus terreus]